MNDKNINDLVIKILNLSKKNKIIMTPIGGMTNSNYLLTIDDVKMVLRLPGVATECFINRGYEKNNSELASLIGINAKTIYFDSATGIKITVYIPDAEVLNPQIVRQQDNIKEISLCFRKLHQSDIKFGNSFNVFSEYEKYKHILDNHYSYLDFFCQKDIFYHFNVIQEILQELGQDRCPCHNDLVAENIIRSNNKIYLIDWEYSGMNDPMWDLASHFLECQFTPNEENIFLMSYFEGGIPDKAKQKILLFKFTQDILWAMWTIIKEENGDNFGNYGVNRLRNAYQLMCQYKEQYDK